MTDTPTLTVEWGQTTGPKTACSSWTDMSSYVVGGSISRGRNYELGRFDAGRLSLTLRTTTRLFDPDNAAGTYYGNLIPMRQIRVIATWNSTDYPLFYGYIASWGNTTDASDGYFETQITATDGFAVLEQIKLPSSAWALEIAADSPDAWFRLGESDTVRLTDSSPNGNYGLYDNCQQGAQGLVVNDADGAAAFAHSFEERVMIQNPNLITGYPFAVSAMVKIKGSDPVASKMILTGLPGTPATVNDTGVEFYVGGPTPRIAALVRNGSDLRVHFSSALVADNRPHHVMAVFTSASSFTIYVDGVAGTLSTVTTSGTGAPAWPGQPVSWTIGNVTDIGGGDYGFGANDVAQSAASIAQGGAYVVDERGTIDEVCIWNGSPPSSTRIAAHSAAALTGREGDPTGTRVGWFADLIEWPSSLRTLDTGISILGPVKWSVGDSALSVLQRWADTEVGQFFMSADGKLIWRSRHYPLLNSKSTTSQASFGDGHGAETYLYVSDGFQLDRDETLIRNPVIASRADGVTVTVEDTTYSAKYGNRAWAAPITEDRDDASVRDRANYLLRRFRDLKTRVVNMRLVPRRDPSNLWPKALGLDIGDRITVGRTPLGSGSANSYVQNIERITHTFTKDKVWTTDWRGSPTDPNVGDYLLLDDATYGLIGADTTFTVATSDVFTSADTGGIANNTPVTLTALTGGTGASTGTTYYIVSSSTSHTFKLSTSQGGSAINITSTGSGSIVSANNQLLAY